MALSPRALASLVSKVRDAPHITRHIVFTTSTMSLNQHRVVNGVWCDFYVSHFDPKFAEFASIDDSDILPRLTRSTIFTVYAEGRIGCMVVRDAKAYVVLDSTIERARAPVQETKDEGIVQRAELPGSQAATETMLQLRFYSEGLRTLPAPIEVQELKELPRACKLVGVFNTSYITLAIAEIMMKSDLTQDRATEQINLMDDTEIRALRDRYYKLIDEEHYSGGYKEDPEYSDDDAARASSECTLINLMLQRRNDLQLVPYTPQHMLYLIDILKTRDQRAELTPLEGLRLLDILMPLPRTIKTRTAAVTEMFNVTSMYPMYCLCVHGMPTIATMRLVRPVTVVCSDGNIAGDVRLTKIFARVPLSDDHMYAMLATFIYGWQCDEITMVPISMLQDSDAPA